MLTEDAKVDLLGIEHPQSTSLLNIYPALPDHD